MKSLWFENKDMFLKDQPVPLLNKDEALLRVCLLGICNTDIELLKGYYNFRGVAGHEFVARVEQCPSRPDLAGKRVVADINCGCGACAWCQSNNARHCPNRKVIGIAGWDGAFAQYLKAPVKNLYVVDPSLEDTAAVFAEPLAAALEISQQVHIKATDKVLVLGDGKLGLLVALALRHASPGLILAGKHERKLQIAQNKGICVARLSSADDAASIRSGVGLFDIVVEATGSARGIAMALELVRPEGTVVAKTTSRDLSALDLAKIVVNEIQIMGSRCGNIALALEFLKARWVDPAPLIDAIYPFEDYGRAFEAAQKPGALKILMKIS